MDPLKQNKKLPQRPEVRCPKDIRNPWGKVIKEMVSDLKTFTNKGCKIAAQNKVSLWANFALKSRILLVSVLLTTFNGS